MITINISLNFSNDETCPSYTSINDALASLSAENNDEVTINIAPGIYHEKVTIARNNVHLRGLGDSPSATVIDFDDFAFDTMPDGSKRGTFRSYTLFIDASNVTLENLTVSNSSGSEFTAGQAIALYSDGDNLTFENCRFESHQDTIFTGPLPPKEVQPGGFIGPKQFAPRINGHQYFHKCYICGNIDFIFGSATAYFEECIIDSLAHGDEKVQGYATAPSTPEGQAYGYVFDRCSFVSSQCPPHSVYLARPWREYAQAVFIDCMIGEHIHPDGFHDWNKPAAHENSFFAAIGCKQVKSSDFSSSSADTDFIPTAEFAKSIDNSSRIIYNKTTVMQK